MINFGRESGLTSTLTLWSNSYTTCSISVGTSFHGKILLAHRNHNIPNGNRHPMKRSFFFPKWNTSQKYGVAISHRWGDMFNLNTYTIRPGSTANCYETKQRRGSYSYVPQPGKYCPHVHHLCHLMQSYNIPHFGQHRRQKPAQARHVIKTNRTSTITITSKSLTMSAHHKKQH